MDDLVKRLRNRHSYEDGVEDLCENAADEIERLRAEGQAFGTYGIFLQQREAIERLREALRRVIAVADRDTEDFRFARAALAGDKTND